MKGHQGQRPTLFTCTLDGHGLGFCKSHSIASCHHYTFAQKPLKEGQKSMQILEGRHGLYLDHLNGFSISKQNNARSRTLLVIQLVHFNSIYSEARSFSIREARKAGEKQPEGRFLSFRSLVCEPNIHKTAFISQSYSLYRAAVFSLYQSRPFSL